MPAVPNYVRLTLSSGQLHESTSKNCLVRLPRRWRKVRGKHLSLILPTFVEGVPQSGDHKPIGRRATSLKSRPTLARREESQKPTLCAVPGLWLTLRRRWQAVGELLGSIAVRLSSARGEIKGPSRRRLSP